MLPGGIKRLVPMKSLQTNRVKSHGLNKVYVYFVWVLVINIKISGGEQIFSYLNLSFLELGMVFSPPV